MGDRDLPHEKLRLAIFWVLFASWPLYFAAFWIAYEVPGPAPVESLLVIGSVLAGVTATAYMLGKFLFQDTQRELTQKTARNESMLSQIHEALAAVGVMRREPLRLIRRDGHDDQGKSG